MSHSDAFKQNSPANTLFVRLANKWALLSLVALAEGPVRFGHLKKALDGISQKMLSQTLKNLAADGLITRIVYHEMPMRVEYELTDMGRSALPHVLALKNWVEASVQH